MYVLLPLSLFFFHSSSLLSTYFEYRSVFVVRSVVFMLVLSGNTLYNRMQGKLKKTTFQILITP